MEIPEQLGKLFLIDHSAVEEGNDAHAFRDAEAGFKIDFMERCSAARFAVLILRPDGLIGISPHGAASAAVKAQGRRYVGDVCAHEGAERCAGGQHQPVAFEGGIVSRGRHFCGQTGEIAVVVTGRGRGFPLEKGAPNGIHDVVAGVSPQGENETGVAVFVLYHAGDRAFFAEHAHASPPVGGELALYTCVGVESRGVVGIGVFPQIGGSGKQFLVAVSEGRLFKVGLYAALVLRKRRLDRQLFACAEKIAVLPLALNAHAGVRGVSRAGAHGSETRFPNVHKHGKRQRSAFFLSLAERCGCGLHIHKAE